MLPATTTMAPNSPIARAKLKSVPLTRGTTIAGKTTRRKIVQVPAPMVAGPATQPTSDLTSRWVIPGLAALAAGTLAALSVWLLYRRRHPAHPNRQGHSHLAH